MNTDPSMLESCRVRVVLAGDHHEVLPCEPARPGAVFVLFECCFYKMMWGMAVKHSLTRTQSLVERSFVNLTFNMKHWLAP